MFAFVHQFLASLLRFAALLCLSISGVRAEVLPEPFTDSIDSQQVLERFERFNNQHFNFDDPFAVVFAPDGPAYFDSGQRALVVPLTLLEETRQALFAKYPNQNDVRERIFADTFEQILWRAYAQALISHFNIKLIGDEHINLDNFVTVMLLNDRFDSADFILDAAEEYLVVERSGLVLDSDLFPSELEYDIFRYRSMACLILGKEDIVPDERIAELALKDPNYASCQDRYLATSQYWVNMLEPHLKASSPMKNWFMLGGQERLPALEDDAVL